MMSVLTMATLATNTITDTAVPITTWRGYQYI